jgi:hypothetical protein
MYAIGMPLWIKGRENPWFTKEFTKITRERNAMWLKQEGLFWQMIGWLSNIFEIWVWL